ncbi:S8 family serine peptidase [Geodermatophilus saharensis]|uniref:S8 family serine peptidase n=1 Tax=Geodermatophilus saharensis TaxID=1137994 RepID=UPI000B7879CF|nr:S8 family serine peptidase [Geodermatophilus saharensis]
MTAAVVGVVLGFGGAAVVDTALAGPPLEEAADFGPSGDGRTRLAVSTPTGIDAATLGVLEQLPAVDSAQRLFDGSALIAGYGITPDTVRAALPQAEVTVSVPGEVAGQAITDPYGAAYGYDLLNTGSNAYNQAAVAGADVAAPTGWQAGTGRGMVVAVVDSGMMTGHPDLAGALWTNPDEACGSADTDGDGYAGDCHGWNFYANSPDVTNAGNDNSHGTGVAGVVGARAGNGLGSAGVAPDVTIMPLVIGGGQSVDLRLGAQAIRYAADHGADVVNASWGGPGAAQILAEAIAYAGSKGVPVVAAAGNDALDRDTSMFYPASLMADTLVKVGNSTASDTVSASSAYGARSVDLFAPGHLVPTTWNDGGTRAVSGTSIAAPHVAAALALYRAHDRAATAAALVDRLLADVQPVAAFAGKSVTGGRLSLTQLGQTAAEVSYTFTGMSADPGTVAPTVVTSGSAPGGEYAVRLRLGMEHQGQVYALSQQQVTVGGVTGTTDDTGAVLFDLGTRPGPSATVAPSLELAQGRYVLTAQLVRDGADVGLASAAPLLVGVAYQAPDTGPRPGTPTPAPGGSTPAPGGPTPPSTTQPGSSTPSTPSTPAPGGSAPPSTTQPGTSTPGGTPAPGGGQPGTPAPGGSTPPSTTQPGTSTPGTPAPGGTAPSSSSPAPGGGTPAPGGSQPGSPAPGGSTPTTGAPAPGGSTPAPGGSAPGPGGQQTYPGVGPFGLTSINPTRVDTAGGTSVTVTGTAVPAGARVRVGSSAQATVTAVSATSVTFTTPARAAGTYDVYVFAPDGTSSVLAGGLTYLDGTGGVSPTPTPSPAPGTPQPGAPQPGAGGGTRPTGGGPLTGPRGERLVPSALFTTLGTSIWRLDCSRSCSGLAV